MHIYVELIVLVVIAVSFIVIIGFLIVPILKSNNVLEKENQENTRKLIKRINDKQD